MNDSEHIVEALINDPPEEEIWGDHIHQGIYDLNTTTKPDRKTAQFRLIEEALCFDNFRLGFKLEMHFTYPFLMGNLILFGPQSAEYTCLIKQRYLHPSFYNDLVYLVPCYVYYANFKRLE
ncbi:hypothetical protein GIB67_011586 [Kingdonia uniflora]|uniref:Uncharacterized protein n=1 Tax=Kingdonia uniflora TaxID=39325 RepID=A0A7J7NLU4_9MAGN|nr:hypothetical protein GIB67_011586 [Kingdonia uniflora]